MKSLTQARRERKRRLPRVGRQTDDHFDFVGGLNLIDSPLSAEPGQCQGCLNYEMGFAGGYQRIAGYLSFDGTVVSAGDYDLLPFGAAANNPAILAVGKEVTGGGSGATGTILTFTTDGGFGVNEFLYNEDFSNAYHPKVQLDVIDDDEVWTNGLASHLSRLTKTVSSSLGRLEHNNVFSSLTGDTIYLSAYVRYSEAGGTETFGMSLSGVANLPFPGTNDNPSVTYNIKNNTVDWSNDAVVDYGIEHVSDDVYRVWWVTGATVADSGPWDVFLGLPIADAAGTYMHIIGLMMVIGTETLPAGGFGYVNTTSAVKNVNSGNLILTPVAGGPFVDDEDLDVPTGEIGQAIGTNTLNGETDPALDAAYTALATVLSAAAPTGSGPIRGVWLHEGTVYAFRDNAGATACDMWEASGAGWSQITLNDVVHFDAGDGTEPSEGNTVTVTAGTKSAAIKRIVKTSGTWGVDAAGYLVLGTVTNGPIANNDELLVSSTRIADADGASAVPVLAAGGRYEFRSHNFYGHADKYRMYGVDGANPAFQYDKDEGVFCQIETGMTTDTPTHLAAHNGHLFLAFAGGSVQLSGDGDPLSWTVITGASEIGVGDEISGFNEEVGNSLFIFTRDSTFVLQGNTRANFDLDDFNINAGAHEWSVQRIGLGCYFDDRGFTTVLQTQRAGSVNFQENAISELIQPLVVDLIKNSEVKCSHLLRNQNIYRCYFDDGRVVSIGFDGHKVSGHMPLEYPFTANVACSEEDTTGGERTFIGAEDGFVYELGVGTSFAGEAINYFMRTVLHHSGSPGRMKKYQQIRLDATLTGALTLAGQVEYDFHNDDFNLADELDFSTDEAGGYWDDFTWDNFVWDKPTSGIPQQKLEGEGVNAALYLVGSSDSDDIHTLRGATMQWMPRRDDRRN